MDSEFSKVGLLDENESVINPATEEKQDDIINSITNTSGTYKTIYIVKSDDTNIYYLGKAVYGTATSSALWQIKKIDSTTGIIITIADGNENFDNEWDERESLSYS